MKNTDALKRFVTDDQILEVLVQFETRKMDACKMLQGYVFPKWQITILEALGIIQNIQKEFNTK